MYNDFYLKPNIKLDLKEDKRSAEIDVTNDGNTPAKNFVLTLETPQDMTKESPQIFSTMNEIKITEINPKLFKIYVSNFANGEGSIIKMNLLFSSEQNINSPKYIAYTTYEQDSTKTTLPQKPLTLVEIISNFWDTYGNTIRLIETGALVLAVINGIYDELANFIRSMFPTTRYKSASEILDSVVYINRLLSSGLTEVKFYDFINKWDQNDDKTRRQLFNNNMKDCIQIDEFFRKLRDRESLIAQRRNPEDLNKINNEILYLCRHLTLEIDWTKYK